MCMFFVEGNLENNLQESVTTRDFKKIAFLIVVCCNKILICDNILGLALIYSK